MAIPSEDDEIPRRRSRPEEEVAAENPTPSYPPRRLFHSSLHNFSFPTLSWGTHKFLRCINQTAGSPTPADDHESRKRNWASSSSPEKSQIGGFKKEEEGRGEEGDKEKGKGKEGEEESSSAIAAAARPWNLRMRRAACHAPAENGTNLNPSSSSSPLETNNPVKSVRLRSEDGEKGKRSKFSIYLAREEIEEDFLALKGTKPPRRPKKRARIVQRQLDTLLPGLWLSEITEDSYKIND